MFTYSTLVVAAFAALAAAAPTSTSAKNNNGFIYHQVLNADWKANGTAEVLKTLAKFGKSGAASAVLGAAGAVPSGSVTATPQPQDSEYLCPVTIGTQTFKLDFDTGSSDLWVLGQGVTTKTKHTKFTPGSAQQQSGETWKISYGDGSSASGIVYSDTVNVGGVQVTGQAVEVAQTASAAFTSGASDGLLGLGFDSINTVKPTPAKTFFSNAIAQGLPKAVMASSLKHNAPGTYDFGVIISSRYTSNITYTPVDNSKGYWGFTPSSYTIGTGAAKTGNLAGIADTGTTLIYTAPAVVKAYYAQVPGSKFDSTQQGYTFPCTATLPDFTLTINGYKAVVPGDFINFAPAGSACFGGIQEDTSIGFSIYGDIFLKSQYVVWDRSQSTPRIGFAPQA